MKFYFSLGVIVIVAVIASLLGYGIYLSQRGETQIAEYVERHKLTLTGARVEERDIIPLMEMELVNLYSDEMADVVALSNGRITRDFVEKNSRVNVDDPILSILDEDIPIKLRQVESDILEAEAQVIKTRNAYNRYQELMPSGAVPAEKYDEVEAAYRAAQARLENFQVQRDQILIQQSRQLVTSPIEGEVLMLYQKVGAYVTAGTPVALVGDFARLRFSAPMMDKYAGRMKLGRELEVSFYGNESTQKSYDTEYAVGNKGDDQVFLARVVKVAPPLSEPAEIRRIVWEIDNRVEILEPGVYSRIRLRSRNVRHCLTVPLTAMTNKKNDEVTVSNAEGTLERRKVETGVNDGTYIEIISGLKAGDVVITSDTDGLKEGIPVEVTDSVTGERLNG